jgi:hypothetical protein
LLIQCQGLEFTFFKLLTFLLQIFQNYVIKKSSVILRTMKTIYCIAAFIIMVIAIFIYKSMSRYSSEHFVAWNNEEVHNKPRIGGDQDKKVLQLFNDIIKEDANKLNISAFSNFKPTVSFESEMKGIVHYILKRINEMGKRRFVALDSESMKKEQTLDPDDRQVVNKWTVNTFIQEKNNDEPHAWSMNITFVMYQKGNVIKIDKLESITQKDPEFVKGINTNDKYYRLMNPYHLNKPWATSGISGDGRDVLMSDEDTDKLLEKWHKDLTTPQYKCFTDTGKITEPAERKGTYEQIGDRYKNQKECESNQGKWDTQVLQDNECGFYRANKNYPNKLGGVKLNEKRCEMPINTKTVGYRYASSDPIHKPWCYNCKDGVDGPGTWGPCCDEQLDVENYPNLASPDYAFPGDELERYQNRDVLTQRGLSWQKFPTHTKNILNKNQRQPVFNAIVGQGPGQIQLPE